MASVGFVIHPKSEDDVYQFVKLNIRLLPKLVYTKTDKNKIEQLFDKKEITALPSLVEKGDATMASKVSKGEISAVFFINPQPENMQGLMELIAVCSKKKIYLAFTIETADCVLGRIGTCTSKTKSVAPVRSVLHRCIPFLSCPRPANYLAMVHKFVCICFHTHEQQRPATTSTRERLSRHGSCSGLLPRTSANSCLPLLVIIQRILL